MAKGYQVGIGSETKAFKQGVEAGIIDPLEDAQKELLDLGRSRGPEQLERSMEDAQDATKRLERETKDAAQTIDREWRDTYRRVKDSADDAYDKAGEGAREFKDEANSTAREAAASFDGSAESIGDAFQEVAANAFGGFGPAGAAAGVAAAAGIGLATQAFTDAQEAAAEAKDEAYSFAFAVLDSGKIAAEASAFRQITEDTEKMADAQKIAKATGMDLTDVILAMATGEGLPLLIENLNKAAETGNAFELNGLIMMLQGAQEGFELGAAGAEVYSQQLYKVAKASGTATGEVDYLGRQILRLPDGKEVVIDAATKTASENVQRVTDDLSNVPKVVNTTVKVGVDSSAYDNWLPRAKSATVRVFGREAF